MLPGLPHGVLPGTPASAGPPTYVGFSSQISSLGGASFDLSSDVLAGDLLVAFMATANEEIPTPTGWTRIEATGNGTPGAAGGIRATVFYRISDTDGPSLNYVTFDDPGNHLVGTLHAFRGVSASSPVNVSATSEVSSATTAISVPGVTTTVDDCLLVAFCATDNDGTFDDIGYSGWANASLVSVTEIEDYGRNIGAGSSVGVAIGVMETAGATGATTATFFQSRTMSNIALALAPA